MTDNYDFQICSKNVLFLVDNVPWGSLKNYMEQLTNWWTDATPTKFYIELVLAGH